MPIWEIPFPALTLCNMNKVGDATLDQKLVSSKCYLAYEKFDLAYEKFDLQYEQGATLDQKLVSSKFDLAGAQIQGGKNCGRPEERPDQSLSLARRVLH